MPKLSPICDLIAFWIFGLANNYAYVIMLSAADDIIANQNNNNIKNNEIHLNKTMCQTEIIDRNCKHLTTSAVLIADILPCLIIKIIAPFFMHRLPFGFRHFLVCFCQALSFIIVAYSKSISMSLVGVALTSIGSGFGESCYLALAAHYPKNTISLWSSGTGGAGILGSLAYAVLTEPLLFGLKPKFALLSMLIVPIIFGLTYWFVLTRSKSIYQMEITNIKTWIVPKKKIMLLSSENETWNSKNENEMFTTIDLQHKKNENINNENKIKNRSKKAWIDNLWEENWILSLLTYMVPLSVVYFAEYLINQGIVELFIFNCANGFGLSKSSQYRWYQVLYQVGVFISRSSVNFIELSVLALCILPILQLFNLFLFYFNAVYLFIPHIGIIFVLILFEGFFGGASYAPLKRRELCLSIATLSDSIGVVIAGFTAFPIHNYICSLSI